MLELEDRAAEVIARRDVNGAASFLSDVVFLKRPHSTDRELVKQSVLAYPVEEQARTLRSKSKLRWLHARSRLAAPGSTPRGHESIDRLDTRHDDGPGMLQ